jgi:DNA-binding transcriptional ArsR family regulator
MEESIAVDALAALAQPSRLAIYRLLVKRGPEGFTPGEISEQLDIPGPTLSFHLKELARAGLVSVRRESRFMHYSASFARMNDLVAYLTENCCSLGTTCDVACAPASTNVRPRRRA